MWGATPSTTVFADGRHSLMEKLTDKELRKIEELSKSMGPQHAWGQTLLRMATEIRESRRKTNEQATA
jgi:hypothetical protein